MRTFLLRSLTFFAFAIVTSILVFFWLHNPTVLPAASEQVKSLVTGEPQASNSEENADVDSAVQPYTVPDEGIKLSSLSLEDGQRRALEAAGIDVETFVITKPMISCGVEKLGERRIGEIVTGGAPTLIETTKLVPCLTR